MTQNISGLGKNESQAGAGYGSRPSGVIH